jgi:DNA-binding PadR family transcriptional regulator
MNLTKAQQAVLVCVANGVTNKYEIAKTSKKAYSLVYYAIQKLLKAKLIETSESRQGEKNPKLEVRNYDLTLLGFCVILDRSHILEHDKPEINEMIERWSHLHPFLSKWRYLNQKIPRSELIASLVTAVEEIDGIWSISPEHRLLTEGGKTLFSKTFLIAILTVTSTSGQFLEVEKWIEAIRGDNKLREYVAKQLRKDVDKERKELEYRENLLKKIEGFKFKL